MFGNGGSKMKYVLSAALALGVLWVAAPARADLVTYNFTTVENGFVPSVPIPNGQAFSGSLTIDTSVPGFVTGPSSALYGGAIKSFNLDGLLLDTSGWSTNITAVASSHGTSFDFLATLGSASIELNLASSTSFDPSLALPTSLPDIATFDLAKGLFFTDGIGTASDTLTGIGTDPVSEPSSLLILVSGIAALGYFGYGRRRFSAAATI
jgi:hypothetical protein